MEVSADKDMGCSAMCGKSKAVLAMRTSLGPRERCCNSAAVHAQGQSQHESIPCTGGGGAVGAREETAGVTEANRL